MHNVNMFELGSPGIDGEDSTFSTEFEAGHGSPTGHCQEPGQHSDVRAALSPTPSHRSDRPRLSHRLHGSKQTPTIHQNDPVGWQPDIQGFLSSRAAEARQHLDALKHLRRQYQALGPHHLVRLLGHEVMPRGDSSSLAMAVGSSWLRAETCQSHWLAGLGVPEVMRFGSWKAV